MPFRDVVGHRSLIALLARSVERDTLPPSLIFAGARGVGKHLAAVAAAQTLNCPRRLRSTPSPGGPESAAIDACGTCAACSRIARGAHPDVLLLAPGEGGSIKIDAIREVLAQTGYRPFEGNRRVVIIDEADALVGPAQSALLKTLEEPPPSSVFILVTTRPDALLDTVRSRCPVLRFLPLGIAEVATVLIRQGRGEKEAHQAAAASSGSVGRALESGGGEMEDVREAAARVLVQAAATEDPRRRIDGAKDLLVKTGGSAARDRAQLGAELRAMASILRDVELLATAADARGLANTDLRSVLDRLTAFQGERGIRAFTAVDRALVALDCNAGVKVVADWVLLNL